MIPSSQQTAPMGTQGMPTLWFVSEKVGRECEGVLPGHAGIQPSIPQLSCRPRRRGSLLLGVVRTAKTAEMRTSGVRKCLGDILRF